MNKLIGGILIVLIFITYAWAQDPNTPTPLDDDSSAIVVEKDVLEITITKTWTERISKRRLLKRKQSIMQQRANLLEELTKVNVMLDMF